MNWITADKDASAHTKGASAPLGATVTSDGANFSIFSRHADLIELLLFEHANAAKPTRIISLESDKHRTDSYWHVFVPGVQPGQHPHRHPTPAPALARVGPRPRHPARRRQLGRPDTLSLAVRRTSQP